MSNRLQPLIRRPLLPSGTMSTQNGHGGAAHGRASTVDPVDCLAVFNDPTLCATLPLHAIAPLLMQIAAGMTRLTALQNALSARLLATTAGGSAPRPGGLEHLLDVQEAAARLGMSVDWLYRHARQLPFTRRVGRRALKFEAEGLARWVATQRRG
jgi:predicted DNA-binding transcriptional regulator AlpA